MGEQTDGSVVGKVFLVSLFEYQYQYQDWKNAIVTHFAMRDLNSMLMFLDVRIFVILSFRSEDSKIPVSCLTSDGEDSR